VLEENGWVLQRIHGSHFIYAKQGIAVILTVPVHGNRDLKRGTLRQLLKTAGLDEADL
jgi:predicted RNA binding protein YcfA (HicA-like mRNA interferase family)